jgi:hypothetical protein
VPTLVLQGSTDTLFDLTDGYGIYEHVRDQGVDARFVAFCGGHVACPDTYVDAGDRAHLDDAIAAWFARYLKGEDVDTGAPVEYRTNEGVWRSTTSFPAPEARPVPVAARWRTSWSCRSSTSPTWRCSPTCSPRRAASPPCRRPRRSPPRR